MAELRAAEEEATLRQEIVEKCERMGFACRFVYESVVISTPVSSWQFDCLRRELRMQSAMPLLSERLHLAREDQFCQDGA